ncbi:hypothetical protein NBRC116492_16540 [Aurantivibrio infirmus]
MNAKKTLSRDWKAKRLVEKEKLSILYLSSELKIVVKGDAEIPFRNLEFVVETMLFEVKRSATAGVG